MRGSLTITWLVVLATLLAGCGTRGTGGVSVDDGRSVLAAAPAAVRDAGTAHLTMTMDFAGQGVPAGARFEAVGQQDFDRRMLSMEGTMSGVPAEMASSMSFIITPDAMYLQMFGIREQLGVDWIRIGFEEISAETGVDMADLMGNQTFSPTAMLDQLAGVTDDIEVIGQDVVRGVATTHYRATIDAQKALETVPESSRETLRTMLAEAQLDEYVVDVWLDEDGLLRRQTMDVEAMGITQSITFEMFDYGAPVDIQVPTDSFIEYADWLERMRELHPASTRIDG